MNKISRIGICFCLFVLVIGCENKGFQKDWNEYGEENFAFEVLSELKKKEEENKNYNKELKTLQEMVTEELNTESIYK
jgi:hypothetical protein